MCGSHPQSFHLPYNNQNLRSFPRGQVSPVIDGYTKEHVGVQALAVLQTDLERHILSDRRKGRVGQSDFGRASQFPPARRTDNVETKTVAGVGHWKPRSFLVLFPVWRRYDKWAITQPGPRAAARRSRASCGMSFHRSIFFPRTKKKKR